MTNERGKSKKLLTYALNKLGDIVFVDDVAKGLDCECICPCCKAKLIAKNGGTKRIHHFAHASGIECEGAYESMLHLLAKERVRKAFLESKDFYMQFVYRSFCPREGSCGYVKYDHCYKSFTKRFNLKDFYDSCEPEIPYDNIRRRSDLKIFSSNNPNLAPVYIEFYVTHASDEEKLHNGERIIEVKIESEEDIERITTEGFIQKEHIPYRYDDEEENNNEQPSMDISFYGFKSEDRCASIQQEIEFSRYILYPSGKSQCYQDAAMCNHLVKAKRSSLFEICIHTPVAFGVYDMVKYRGFKRFGIKNCILCRNWVERYDGMGKICRMYKSLGISKWEPLDTARAKECRCFQLNEEEMNVEMKQYDSLLPEEKTEFV